MGRINESESKGGDFEETLQELIDWKEEGVPTQYGIRKGEKKLFNFRKKRRETYGKLLTTLDNFKTENEEQEQQVLQWSKLFKERLARIEMAWEHRKTNQ
jgi:hypothetical protein